MKILSVAVTIFIVVLWLRPNHAKAQWIQTNGPAVSRVYSFTVSNANLLAGTNGGIYVSTDNGTNWTAVNSTVFSKKTFYAFAASGTNLFAGTSDGVLRSTDNGTWWTSSGNLNLPSVFVYALAVSGNTIFAAGDGVSLSTNNGTNWTRIAVTNSYFNALAVCGPNLIAGTIGGVYLSSDNGTSWTPVAFTNTYVKVFALSGTNLFAGTPDYSASTTGGVFLSTNNGASWTAINSGLSNTSVYTLAISGTSLFAGTDGGGVFLSTNSGASWISVNDGLTNTRVYALAICGTNLFAGTYGGGVWRRPLSQMVTSLQHSAGELPNKYRLEQNYPNPFNPSTTIEFSLPSPGLATIKIFNLLGEEVAILVNEGRPAGTSRVEWASGNIPSGVYYYQLRAGAFRDAKKLIVLR